MKKATYKKIGEQIVKERIIVPAEYDELGNLITEEHEAEVEVIINITDDVTEEVEVKDLPQEELHHQEPTQLDVIEAQVMFTALMTDTLLEV